MNSEGTEKRIAERIAKHIIEKDSLKNYTYSGNVFLHINSERLNDKNYKTLISLNGLESKSAEFRTERMNIDGFETIIYYEKSKRNIIYLNHFLFQILKVGAIWQN